MDSHISNNPSKRISGEFVDGPGDRPNGSIDDDTTGNIDPGDA
jgi:hypothetical protein